MDWRGDGEVEGEVKFLFLVLTRARLEGLFCWDGKTSGSASVSVSYSESELASPSTSVCILTAGGGGIGGGELGFIFGAVGAALMAGTSSRDIG